VPIQQQISERESEEIEGFVSPLIIDEEKVKHIASIKGRLSDVKIIQNKLIVTHSYGGGESDRENTKLLWSGRHYQNSKGEYMVDLILFSDKIDNRRALLQERKILDIAGVQVKEVNVVWINLLGYDQLIRYSY
jgi:hypothetical protein